MDIRRGDNQILANKGSPEVLNRAYSTARFLNSIMTGLRGDSNVSSITLCRTDLVPGTEYFSLPVIFGREGIIKRFGLPNTSPMEDEMVEQAIKHIKKDIDKAAFVVKEAVDLTKKKYFSSNDRASSQKEMFDLYVKCLPKEEDGQTQYISEASTDYSFKRLIKDGPKINPFEVPENKFFEGMVRKKLKNVASEDSILKSTGAFTSPFERPIIILEPMGCPSSPCPTTTDHPELLPELQETEEKSLHENILSQETKSQDRDCQASRRYTFENGVVEMKSYDPLNKFKSQQAKQKLNKENCQKETNVSLIKGTTNKSKEMKNQKILSKLPPCVKSPSAEEQYLGDLMFDQISNNTTSKKLRTNYINPRQQLDEIEMSDDHEILKFEGTNIKIPTNEQKCRRLVDTILRKLNWKKEGSFSALPTALADHINGYRHCNTNRKTSVRSRHHSTVANDFDLLDYFNSELKKKPLSEAEHSNGTLKMKKGHKSTASIPKPKPFLNQNCDLSDKCVEPIEKVNSVDQSSKNNESDMPEAVNVACPRCHCKLIFKKYKNECGQLLLNEEVKLRSGGCEECVKNTTCDKDEYLIKADEKLNNLPSVGKNKSIVKTPVYTPKNCAKDSAKQEERLKKLREKINQKLIPLLNKNSFAKVTPEKLSVSAKLNACHTDNLKAHKQFSNGIPLVLDPINKITAKETHEKINSPDPETRRNEWTGVPFIVNRNVERTTSTEKDLIKEDDTILLNNQLCNKTLKKTNNKLQLLAANFNIDEKSSKKEEISETKSSVSRNNDTQNITKNGSGLNIKDIFSYIKTRHIGAERKCQPKIEVKDQVKDLDKIQEKNKENPANMPLKITLKAEKEICTPKVNSNGNQDATLSLPTAEAEKVTESEIELSKKVVGEDNLIMIEGNEKSDSARSNEVGSKPSETTVKISSEEKICSDITFPDMADKNETNEVKNSQCVSNKHIAPTSSTTDVQILSHKRMTNKLQLLTQARKNASNVKANPKSGNRPKNTWESALSSKPVYSWNKMNDRMSPYINDKTLLLKGKLNKMSASQAIAPKLLYKTNQAACKSTLRDAVSENILEGLSFPVRKHRKPCNNLLKQLTLSVSQRQEDNEKERKLRHFKMNSSKLFKQTKLSNSANNISRPPRVSAEYIREEEIGKMASEVIANRQICSKRESDTLRLVKNKSINANRRQKAQPKVKHFKIPANPRNNWTDFLSVNTAKKCGGKVRNTLDTFESKILSMPHIRHQPEYRQSKPGPIEVQPGLSQLNYRNVSSPTSPLSELVNEYSRSNVIPSLKDTRVTFHLEEFEKPQINALHS